MKKTLNIYRCGTYMKLLFGMWVLIVLAGCSRLGASENQIATATIAVTQTDSAPVTASPTLTPMPTEIATRGTISIWHSWNDEQISILEQIIAEFQTLYPDVQFDILYIPVENLQKRFEVAAHDGTAPDLLFGPAEWGPGFYNAGWLVDLSGLVDEGVRRNITPAGLGAARYKNATIGMPYAQEGVVLYRNQLIIPESPASFDELVRLAKSATQGDVIGADLELGLFYSGAHLNGILGSWINSDGTPAFNTERGLEWLKLLKAFERAGPTEYLSDRDLELFSQGRVGMIIDGTWNMQSLSEAIGAENLAIDPWPSYQDGNLSGYVRTDNIYLTKQSQGDDQAAAAKFIEYFLSTDVQSRLAEGDFIPILSGVPVTDPLNARLITQAMIALAGGTSYPVIPEFASYTGPLEVMINEALNLGIAPEEALNTAFQTINTALLAAKATSTPTP